MHLDCSGSQAIGWCIVQYCDVVAPPYLHLRRGVFSGWHMSSHFRFSQVPWSAIPDTHQSSKKILAGFDFSLRDFYILLHITMVCFASALHVTQSNPIFVYWYRILDSIYITRAFSCTVCMSLNGLTVLGIDFICDVPGNRLNQALETANISNNGTVWIVRAFRAEKISLC